MVALVALVSMAAFLILMATLGIVPRAKAAIAETRGAAKVLTNPGLAEEAKEVMIQQASLRLLGYFADLTLRGLAALALSLLVVLLADWVGLAPAAEVRALLEAPTTLICLTLAMLLGWLLFRKRRT